MVDKADLPDDFRSAVSDDGTQAKLAGQGITDVPDWLQSITTLTSLDLADNEIKSLPDWLGDMPDLVRLDLSGNDLATLPDSIGNLVALNVLLLDNNNLGSLPESVGNLIALRTLSLDGNELRLLPESIGNLSSLTRLELNDNQLSTLPDSITSLTELATLRIMGNRLISLPESVGNLIALRTLSLDGNELRLLPESIGNLSSLTRLELNDNQLSTLPDSITNLTELTTLALGGNHLTSVTTWIGNFSSLTRLELNDNRLSMLPETLGNLTELITLNLAGNKITTLPVQLAMPLTKGLNLKLEGNPLEKPLRELIDRGQDSLASYLRSLEDAQAQYEAKLLFVGEGNVGKTSLIAALHGAPFVEGRPTTHGIEISHLTFSHPHLEGKMTLRAWDFGGQEVYRVTHQFFFSQRALYLVVWNAREGSEQNEVEGWIHRIRLRIGPQARIMIVATHCADRLAELDYPRLQNVFPEMLVGNFEVDNLTGDGLQELSEAIRLQAAQLPQMGERVSLRWVAAREEVLSRAPSEPQITYERFVQICRQNKVTGGEIIALARLMHDLGQVIYYDDDEGLRDIVVLNPEWLTKAISYVLEDKPTRDADGILDHSRLKNIWHNRVTGLTYPSRYHRYFLRLMEKFDVSYRLEGDELRSLVAQLVPHKRPQLPWQSTTRLLAGVRSIAMICYLSEPVPGLVPWLTVRHHRAATGIHWRRGVFLRHPIAAYSSEALIELIHDNELAVEVRAPSPDLYFNVLRDSIEDLVARRWPGLTYRLFIPCPNRDLDGTPCPGKFPLEGLLRMRESGHTQYPCIECIQVNEIAALVTGFTVPERSLDVELRMQLARIENGVIGLQGQAADMAEAVRRILGIVSVEVTDCPRLFTLVSEALRGSRRIGYFHYRLTLWCEHPGYWHPTDGAVYEFDQPKEWFIRFSSYAKLVLKALQIVAPLVGSIEAAIPTDQLGRIHDELDSMTSLIESTAEGPDDEVRPSPAAGQLTSAEGQALRALRTILFDYDRSRVFGGMRRVQAPSGDLLWVCQQHYSEYDPGLPVVP